jgi:hypothetical protein
MDLEKRLDDPSIQRSGDDESQRGTDVDAIVEEEESLERATSTAEKPKHGLSAVLSRTFSRASTVDPGPPPDGGAKAWMIGQYPFLPPFHPPV